MAALPSLAQIVQYFRGVSQPARIVLFRELNDRNLLGDLKVLTAASLGAFQGTSALRLEMPETIQWDRGSVSGAELLSGLRELTGELQVLLPEIVARGAEGEIFPIQNLPEVVNRTVAAVLSFETFAGEFSAQANNLLSVLAQGPVSNAQAGPVVQLSSQLTAQTAELKSAVRGLARTEGLAPEMRETISGIEGSLDAVSVSPMLLLEPGPTPAEFLERQILDLADRINEFVPLINSLLPVLELFPSEFPGFKFPSMKIPAAKPVGTIGASGRRPLEAVEAFLPAVQFIARNLREEGVSLEAVTAVTRLAGGFVQEGFPSEVAIALLEISYPDLKIGERLYALGYLQAREPRLAKLARKVYEDYYKVDVINAGAEVIVFGDRLPTAEELLSFQLSLQMKTKLFIRLVAYEGVDEALVSEIRQRIRAKLDFSESPNPIAERFDFSVVKRQDVAEWLRDLPMRRMPGADRTLYEAMRRVAPEKIVTPLDLYAHLVVVGAQDIIVQVELPADAWRVYPSHDMNSKKFRNYSPYMLGLKLVKAALTRDQLPDEDRREFKLE
ncbi:MAG TPA: hypothetical protein PKL97_10225, partial [Candidatus Omnitrophota bacterium]|nr:hypothetical protein [Candidatus Omnitrophota bacterium]